MAKRLRFALSWVFSIGLFITFFSAKTQAQELKPVRMVIFNANVVDLEAGKILYDHDVLIEGNKIIQVSPNGKLTPSINMRVVMGKDRYLVTGLWDMAAILNDSLSQTNRYIAKGIIGIQNSMTKLNRILSWRDSITNGLIFGPIMYAGASVQNALNYSTSIESIPDSLINSGAHVLRTDRTNSDSLFWAILNTARERKVFCGGEIPEKISWAAASNKGMHIIELNNQAIPDLINAAKALPDMARNATYLCPNLNGWYQVLFPDSSMSRFLIDSNKITHKVESPNNSIAGMSLSDRQNLWTQLLRFTKQAWHLGVPILAGSFENSNAAASTALILNLVALEKAGIPKEEVLKIAMINPATCFGIQDRFGTIAPNKFAQLLLLHTNPFEHLEALSEIEAMILWGNMIDFETLYAIYH